MLLASKLVYFHSCLSSIYLLYHSFCDLIKWTLDLISFFQGSPNHLEYKIQSLKMTHKTLCHLVPVYLSSLLLCYSVSHYTGHTDLSPIPLILLGLCKGQLTQPSSISTPTLPKAGSFTSFRPLFTCHLLQEVFFDHFIQSWPPSFLISASCMFLHRT